MNRLFLLGMLAQIVLQCSPAPGWVPPTINEQVNLAGAVFKGKVLSVSGNQFSGFVVRYTNVEYFKGCGPSTVRVTGYTSSAACGIDPPAVGSVNFVFACKGNDWALNNYTLHTGSVIHTAQIEQDITNYTGNELQCSNCCYLFYKCKKRPEVSNPLPVPTDFAK